MTSTAQGRPAPIPLTLLTGFLGAGKTTVLNRMLRDPDLADTVVIINEFGEIGIDHLLVETVTDGMVLLSAGCLCCTVRGDLIATLEDLLRKRDNGRITPFRRVVIETTGLADPAPILHGVLYHPYLSMRYALQGVVTVVDAVNGAGTLDEHEEAVRQAAVADRIVLSKTDIASPEAVADLRERLARLAPGARIVVAADPDTRVSDIIGEGLFSLEGKIADVAEWLQADAVEEAELAAHEAAHGHHHHGHHHHGHHHDHHDHHDHGEARAHGQDHAHQDHAHHDHAHHDHADDDHTHHDHTHHGHTHDVNRHDASIRAFCLTHDQPVNQAAFDMFLDLLRSAHGPKLLRVKGLVSLANDPDRPVLIHGVQHVFHVPAVLETWPDEDRRSRMVFIVKDLDRSFVERLWDAFLGRPSIDRPDRAALTDNPLAIPGQA